jgi:hypothetical protein
VLALALPLSTALIGIGAAPALAAGGSLSTNPTTSVITSGTSVSVQGTITSGTNATVLALSMPGGCSSGCSVTIDACTQKDNPLTPRTDETCYSRSKTLSASLTGRPNGKWTATLSGGYAATKVFYTNFAPTADPTDLTAQGTGASRMDLTWSYAGTEPDPAGFRISDGQGNTFQVDPSACSGSACSYTAYYDNPTPGTYSYTYAVTALRKSGGCDSCGTYTESGASNSAAGQLVTPQPPPSPTPTPSSGSSGGTTGGTTGSTTGGSTGGTTGSSTTTGGTTGSHSTTSGGTTGSASKPVAVPTLPPLVASRRSFALSFNHFSPSLGIPKLPPLPATKFPVTAAGSEAYNPTLPYTAQPRKTTSVLSSPIAAITDSVDPTKLATALAFALILLAAAAHVRVFLSHTAED